MQFVLHLDDRTVSDLVDPVAAGTVVVPRPTDAPVLFETQGVAIQDVAVCALAYERYAQQPEIQEAI